MSDLYTLIYGICLLSFLLLAILILCYIGALENEKRKEVRKKLSKWQLSTIDKYNQDCKICLSDIFKKKKEVKGNENK